MKKILILLLCLLAINISGCSKKDNNDNEILTKQMKLPILII